MGWLKNLVSNLSIQNSKNPKNNDKNITLEDFPLELIAHIGFYLSFPRLANVIIHSKCQRQ